MKVLYYYYFIFYSRIYKQSDPYFFATTSLSVTTGLFITYMMDLFYVQFNCKFIENKTIHLSIYGVIFIINLWYFLQKRNGITVVKEKPKFFNHNGISVFVAITFALLSISFPFWMADYLMYVIENCN